MEMKMERLIKIAKRAKGIAYEVSTDFFPRYRSILSRPIRIAAGFGEYRKRIDLVHGAGSSAARGVADLRGAGYHILDQRPAAIAELCATASARLQTALDLPSKGKKAFFSQLFKAEDKTLSNPFMRVALDEQILTTVATYLGCAPYLEYVDVLYSKPVEKFSSSQLWHKDRTDSRLVKLCVYCLDVGEENGPFSFFDAPDSGRVPALIPHYVSDDRMSAYIPLSNQVRILGKAGTAFLIDTSKCFHYGSRCEKPRLAMFVYYSTGFSYKPREASWESCFESAAGCSPLQKAALGLV